jgi:hypothetical protein
MLKGHEDRSGCATMLSTALAMAPIHPLGLTDSNEMDSATQAATFELLDRVAHYHSSHSRIGKLAQGFPKVKLTLGRGAAILLLPLPGTRALVWGISPNPATDGALPKRSRQAPPDGGSRADRGHTRRTACCRAAVSATRGRPQNRCSLYCRSLVRSSSVNPGTVARSDSVMLLGSGSVRSKTLRPYRNGSREIAPDDKGVEQMRLEAPQPVVSLHTSRVEVSDHRGRPRPLKRRLAVGTVEAH